MKTSTANLEFTDLVPRYAPERVLVFHNGKAVIAPVLRYVSHPPHNHPKNCPIVDHMVALEMQTAFGSSWWGFDQCWINTELRMVVRGFSARNELVSKWEVCRNP